LDPSILILNSLLNALKNRVRRHWDVKQLACEMTSSRASKLALMSRAALMSSMQTDFLALVFDTRNRHCAAYALQDLAAYGY